MTYFPDEILCMVCFQLWHQRDFNTLFNCACSGKQLATIALMNFYRMQVVAAATTNDWGEEDTEIATPGRQRRIKRAHAKALSKERIFTKCTGLWRIITLSSLGKTLYPYSQYIRTLDLRDLEKLLILSDLRATANKNFFQGELAQFKVDTSHFILGGEINHNSKLEKVDALESINRIGEVITKQTPLLEVLTGKGNPPPHYSREHYFDGSPRLTYLEIWHDAVFEDIGSRIRLHCPSFKGLHLQEWYTHLENWNDYDSNRTNQGPAPFLNEIRPQSLESFEIVTCFDQVEPEVFQALSCHGDSLTKLKIRMLPWTTTSPNLSLLRGCTNLVSLSLSGTHEDYYNDLQVSSHDGFCETFSWLKEWKRLQILSSMRFLTPAWIIAIFLESSIHLTSLRFNVSEMPEIKDFLLALATQTSLQRLWLIGEMDELEVHVLVESLSTLVNLTDLHLVGIGVPFVDRHIVQLAGCLSKLEVWSTDADRLTDAIWDEVASLRSLWELSLCASTAFTTDGILDFIEKLGPGNKGLVVSVEAGWVEYEDMYSQIEEASIQEIIAEKLQGKFKFTVLSEPDLFSSEDDWFN